MTELVVTPPGEGLPRPWLAALRDLRTLRRPMFVAVAVFVLGALLGAFLAYSSALRKGTDGGAGGLAFLDIFGRNAGVVAGMALGAVTLGVVTVGVLAINGLMCGVAVEIYASSGQVDKLWTGLAPHFLPEVGAFCLAASADLWLAVALLSWIRTGARPPVGVTLRIWLVPQILAIGLLALAAVIETYVSSVR